MGGEIKIKWSSKEVSIKYGDGDTVATLKRKIQEETRVQPKRQKIMGLKAKGGKMAADDTPLTELVIKPGAKLMMLGWVLRLPVSMAYFLIISPKADLTSLLMPCRTPEEETAQLDAQAEIAPHIQDDFDIADDTLQTIDIKDNPEYQVSKRACPACCCTLVLHLPPAQFQFLGNVPCRKGSENG